MVLKRNSVEAFFLKSAAKSSLRRDVERYIGALARLSPTRPARQSRMESHRTRRLARILETVYQTAADGQEFLGYAALAEPRLFRRRKVITIEPGMAFGTGTHATTRGCMEFIEAARDHLNGRGFSALDVGTGSGILAIALAILDARPISAVDNDPVALQVARENFHRNGVGKKICLSGAALSALRRRFDLVVANLTAETILELGAALEKKVAKNGFLILSGILHHQAGAVTASFAGRFRVRQRKRSREWVTLLLQRE